MIYFKLSANVDGRFGHQLSNIIVGLSLSRIFSGYCINPIFIGKCSIWNNYLNLKSLTKEPPLKDREIATLNSYQLDYSSADNVIDRIALRTCYSLSYSDDDLIVKLPYDAFFHESMYRAFLPELSSLPSSLQLPTRQIPLKNQISLHVRRGDVSPTYASSLYTPNEVYIHSLLSINDKYPSEWPVVVYSQGEPSLFRQLVKELSHQSNREVFLSLDSDITSFDARSTLDDLISSKVLIGSHSSFLHFALFLAKGSVERYFISHRRHGIDVHIESLMTALGITVIKPIQGF